MPLAKESVKLLNLEVKNRDSFKQRKALEYYF
jgi:hypothetical protein